MALFRSLRHGRSLFWGRAAILGAHSHGGARELSYVPVDDIVSGLTDDQIQLRETARNFCDKELAPYASDIDQNNDFPKFRVSGGCVSDVSLQERESYEGFRYYCHVMVNSLGKRATVLAVNPATLCAAIRINHSTHSETHALMQKANKQDQVIQEQGNRTELDKPE